jgi:hypothetical protein
MTEDRIMALIHYLTHGRPFLNGFIAYVKHIDSTMRSLHIHPAQVAHQPRSAKANAAARRFALRQSVMSQSATSFHADSQLFWDCTGKHLSMNAGMFVLACFVTATRSGVACFVTTTRSGVA